MIPIHSSAPGHPLRVDQDACEGYRRSGDPDTIWVSNLCDRANPMYAGRIVEGCPVRDLFYGPSHGNTFSPMPRTPSIDIVSEKAQPIEGLPPDLRGVQS
jgi:ABC-type dipeptide/oligopeptide/nickel transport system ATPase component